MSEGWCRELLGSFCDPCSAGTDPHGVDPRAVEAMLEAGVDISAHTSKSVAAVDPETLDLVITVCDRAHESCPVFLGDTRILHHGFDDPPRLARDAGSEAEAFEHYRRVRDEIRVFIETELRGALGLRRSPAS